MKAPVGLLSDGTVCVSRWRGFAPTSSMQVSVEGEIRNHRLTDISHNMISGGYEHEVRCKSLQIQHGHRLRGTVAPGWENEISIDCTGVEDALDVTIAQQTELDYLIYNDPLAYAELILNGEPEKYLKNVTGSHRLEI